MSERVENRSEEQAAPATKAGRRLAAQLAEKKAAEARRRRQSMLGAAAGVLAVVALVGGLVWLNSGDDDKPATASSASPSAPADQVEPTAPPAPELPADIDPALKTKPTVKAGSGELTKLKVTTLVKGKGAPVKSGQTITTNYVGVFYKDGKQFDASWDNGQPATFPIGVGQVIKGWDQGLVGVPVGSRVQLDLPADLAYGDNAEGGRPAGPLRFVVDVLAAQ
ncbi:FKBP-type peptidyl-prolyl cis-trans isomerase [Micromonospora sp. WMMD998]|uniref:FKBP-type peptidyl-prolyl cis-trans isomerase n=1 Tax=Micromonospora sp. WMMD998 TaxID=3016092 RepID=UPI00249AFD92|nr:FKBP-type peptidyl-prolyl cis-trans isomerase [Micromonospora sp. WMMD998]WFE38100.1 FKBP-type peptidyl-prolyl cis-trans isomerase [Micromonospora sp. WMMD998]